MLKNSTLGNAPQAGKLANHFMISKSGLLPYCFTVPLDTPIRPIRRRLLKRLPLFCATVQQGENSGCD